MGVGNFFGLLPQEMAASRLYGVELDSITGRTAKQLYPDADITNAFRANARTDVVSDIIFLQKRDRPIEGYTSAPMRTVWPSTAILWSTRK